MILGITGHRKVENKVLTYRKVLKYLKQKSPTHVNIGGAKGFDSLVMRACFVLQIPYTLYLPYKGFVRRDYKIGSITYQVLLDNAVEVFYEADKYTNKGIYMQRNKKIVDSSDEFLIYFNGKSSGTKNTINYVRWSGHGINDFKNVYL